MKAKKQQKTQSGRVTHDATVSHLQISPDQLVEEIRKRAEEIFKARKGAPGDPIEDWLLAEKQIKSKYRILE